MSTETDKMAARIKELEAALRLLLFYEPGGTPPLTLPRGLAVDRARAALLAAREG